VAAAKKSRAIDPDHIARGGFDLEHFPEKWSPVSRLREALARLVIWLDASAGEGRSVRKCDHSRRLERFPGHLNRKAL
jgi:hypothetical protein